MALLTQTHLRLAILVLEVHLLAAHRWRSAPRQPAEPSSPSGVSMSENGAVVPQRLGVFMP